MNGPLARSDSILARTPKFQARAYGTAPAVSRLDALACIIEVVLATFRRGIASGVLASVVVLAVMACTRDYDTLFSEGGDPSQLSGSEYACGMYRLTRAL